MPPGKRERSSLSVREPVGYPRSMTVEVLANGLVEHPLPAPFPFGPASVADILVPAMQDHPDRLALIDGDRTWTYAELDAAVASASAGFAPGESANPLLGNSAEMVIATLGAFRAGAVVVFSNSIDAAAEPSEIDQISTGAIAFTSGTTGKPKAVAHSQRSLLVPGLVSVDVEPPKPGERIGTPLSLQIMNVMALGPISTFVRGSTFVVMNQRFATGMAEDIATYGVTRLITVPTLAHDLAFSDDVEPGQLSSLDRVILGGSGGDAEMQRRFEQRFGVRPTLSYGLTEAPTGVIRESFDDPIGSRRGFPLPHIEAAVVDLETGATCEPGEPGELVLRPASTGHWARCWTGTLGYLGDPDRTRQLFSDAGLHTGDMAIIDSDGAISILGRLDSMIVRGGMNIDPQAIKAVVLDDPDVFDAFVIGIPDVRLGERIGVSILAVDDSSDGDRPAFRKIDRERIRQAIADRVSRDAVPDVIVTSPGWRINEMGKVLGPDIEDFDRGDYDYGVRRTPKGRLNRSRRSGADG